MYGADELLANAILNTDDTMRTEDLRVEMLSLHGYNRMSLIFRILEGAQVLNADSYSNVRFLTDSFTVVTLRGERFFCGFQ